MKPMNKLLIGILLATHFMGCKPVDVLPEPVSPNTTSAVIWKQKLPTNRLVSPPLYHEGKIILAQSNVAQAYDTDSGKLIWETPVRAEPLDFEGCFLVGERLFFLIQDESFVLIQKLVRSYGEMIYPRVGVLRAILKGICINRVTTQMQNGSVVFTGMI
jgi:hypothetical protein